MPDESTKPRKGPADWIRTKKPAAWQLAAATHAGKWEANWPQLTEAEFDAAIAAAGNISIG